MKAAPPKKPPTLSKEDKMKKGADDELGKRNDT
jgi:hypothetical protein